MFENPRRGRQARNFTTNVPKILDLKSSSEQIFSENWRWVPLLSRISTGLCHVVNSFVSKIQNTNINDLLLNFVWDNEGDKIKRIEMIADYRDGGLKMLNIIEFKKT